jgi:hypothetical protein
MNSFLQSKEIILSYSGWSSPQWRSSFVWIAKGESVYMETGWSHIIDLLTHIEQCKTENILINNVLLYLFSINTEEYVLIP